MSPAGVSSPSGDGCDSGEDTILPGGRSCTYSRTCGLILHHMANPWALHTPFKSFACIWPSSPELLCCHFALSTIAAHTGCGSCLHCLSSRSETAGCNHDLGLAGLRALLSCQWERILSLDCEIHGDKEVREESWGHRPTSNGRPPWRHGTSRGQPRGRHSWCLCCCLCTSWSSPHAYLDLLLDWLCYQILSLSSQPSLSSILCHKGDEGTEAGVG